MVVVEAKSVFCIIIKFCNCGFFFGCKYSFEQSVTVIMTKKNVTFCPHFNNYFKDDCTLHDTLWGNAECTRSDYCARSYFHIST